MTKFTTADGFTFHLVGGQWVDNLDPEKVDGAFDYEQGLIELLSGQFPGAEEDIETYVLGADDTEAYFAKIADQAELFADFRETFHPAEEKPIDLDEWNRFMTKPTEDK